MSKAETTSAWPGRQIRFDAAAAELARRRAEVECAEAPRNSGRRRTIGKRTLLKAIKEAGGNW